MENKKPPLGIEPEWIWFEVRIRELHSAIGRYLDAGKYDEEVAGWCNQMEGLIREYQSKYSINRVA